jgi:hypothetical protein
VCFTAKRFEKLAGGKRSVATGRLPKIVFATLKRVPEFRFWHPFRMHGIMLTLPVVRLSATTG